MRARWMAIAAALMVGVAGVWWYNRAAMAPSSEYAVFSSPKLGLTFQYPKTWKVHEVESQTGGGRIGEIQVFGPRREDLDYSIYLDVSVEPLPDPGTSTLEETVERALNRRLKLLTYRIVEQRPGRLAGRKGIEISAAYTLRLPIGSPQRSAVNFQEALAYAVNDKHIVRVAYAAPVENFPDHQHAFRQLVKTLKRL